jgi:hypothetical protein
MLGLILLPLILGGLIGLLGYGTNRAIGIKAMTTAYVALAGVVLFLLDIFFAHNGAGAGYGFSLFAYAVGAFFAAQKNAASK